MRVVVVFPRRALFSWALAIGWLSILASGDDGAQRWDVEHLERGQRPARGVLQSNDPRGCAYHDRWKRASDPAVEYFRHAVDAVGRGFHWYAKDGAATRRGGIGSGVES